MSSLSVQPVIQAHLSRDTYRGRRIARQLRHDKAKALPTSSDLRTAAYASGRDDKP
jgi:hypothetical protein